MLNIKKVLSFIPAVFWMGVIYWLSDRPAPESSVQSEGMAMKIVLMLSDSSGMSEADRMDRALYLEPYIREIAHVLEYAILAAAILIAVKAFVADHRKAAFITLVICFLYACTDEWHQYYIPGRAAEIIDIVFDTSGAAAAMLVYIMNTAVRRRRVRKGIMDEDN